MKFTFKQEKRETGLRAVGHPWPDTAIRLNGKEVGTITAPTWQTRDGQWKINLMVVNSPTPQDPSDFKWVTLKWRGPDADSAKKFLLDNQEAILKLNLYADKN